MFGYGGVVTFVVLDAIVCAVEWVLQVQCQACFSWCWRWRSCQCGKG